MSNLSPEWIAEMKKNFQLFDKNGDGSITRNELSTVMRCLGQNPTNAEITEIITAVDSSGNGKIEFQEFLKCMGNRGMNSQEKEKDDIVAAFKVLDRDQNGFITAQELRHTMTCLGERLTEEEADAMIRDADTNGDGCINYHELAAVMASKH